MSTAASPDQAHPQFRVETLRAGWTFALQPVGELDLSTVSRLEGMAQELLDNGADGLLLDLGRVAFIDSSGVKTILALDARASDEGWTLTVLPGPPQVQRVFEYSGMLGRLSFAERQGSR